MYVERELAAGTGGGRRRAGGEHARRVSCLLICALQNVFEITVSGQAAPPGQCSSSVVLAYCYHNSKVQRCNGPVTVVILTGMHRQACRRPLALALAAPARNGRPTATDYGNVDFGRRRGLPEEHQRT